MAIKARVTPLEGGEVKEGKIVFVAGEARLLIIGSDGDATMLTKVKVPKTGRRMAIALLKTHCARKGYKLEPR